MSLNIPVLNEDILYEVLQLLSIDDLLACRSVNRTWHAIVEDIFKDDDFWRTQASQQFSELFMSGRRRRIPGLSWREWYRSQMLWASLGHATVEEVTEFEHATNVSQEICNLQLVRNGIVAIHTRSAINHLNILNGEKGLVIKGEYKMFAENNNHNIIINKENHCVISRKTLYNSQMIEKKTYYDVVYFLLLDPVLLMITSNNDLLYVCLKDKLLVSVNLIQFNEPVISIGFAKDLFILTNARNIYTLVDDDCTLIYTITKEDDLLNVLLKYNLTNDMDWLAYEQWMYIFGNVDPEAEIQDITAVRKYGDIVLIGTKWSDLLIYYLPRNQEIVSLYKQTPVKRYNLSELKDIPKCMYACPIVHIDVLEGRGTHIILVATPYKVTTISLNHRPPPKDQEQLRKQEDAQRILSLQN